MKKIYEVRLYIPSEKKGGESNFLKLRSFESYDEAETYFFKIWDENRLIFQYLPRDSWSDIFFKNWIMKNGRYLDLFLYLVEANMDPDNPNVYLDSINLNNNGIRVLRLIYDSLLERSEWNNECDL